MWVWLLAGPRALESSVKVSCKDGAPAQGEYSEAIEPVVVFPGWFARVIVTYLVVMGHATLMLTWTLS